MTSWETGPTAYAGPASLVPQSPVPARQAEPDPLRAAGALWWLDVLDSTIRTCGTHGRSEVAEWLSRRRAQLLRPELRVLVVGAAHQGKSQLINALINAGVCAVDAPGGTVVPAVVHHAESPAAQLIRRGSPSAEWTAEVGLQDRVPLGLEALDAAITEAAARFPAGTPVHADIAVPRTLLAGGLVLIDTPALPGLPASAERALGRASDLATYAGADLVLYTCEAGRELTDAELAVLQELARFFPGLLVVFTKTDYAIDWRRNLADSRTRLARAGVPAATTAVSATLRLHALRAGDTALNNESGFTDLIVHLQQMVAAKPDRLARDTVSRLGRIALEELAGPLRDELTAQQNAGLPDAVARLHTTQRRLDDLRKCAVRWQNTLSDEVGDLMSDIEHDLRERIRAVLAESDEYFTTADPAKAWDEFEPWLRQALTDLTGTSLSWLAERIEWMARRVADQFPPEVGEVLPPSALVTADERADGVPGLDAPPVAKFTPGQKLFIGLRGSYGGVIMFGLATSLAGMSLINPISIGGGALFGGKTIRDESKSLLKKRQAEARTAVQRHVDDIFVGLNKEARDTVRRAQRALRDHFTAVTEDLQEIVMESLRNAKAAADQDVAAREQHARRLQQELAVLVQLHSQARALGGRG
ncbi:dynamin family protein [Actinoplanes auranticolor]|uniref:Isoniazid inducible gene protein IniA n=1 Tax=Actinoplanes auranticolor TaxID=47988 RepID=A0A919S726_9ACTN|nr:dynamin family protein [Actinoplanes auranticolor]GIM66638.1 isoniazid inducible gene protein IniA [Actinoplanes auranticolor]